VEHTFVTMEVGKILQQLVSVAHQDLNYGPGLVWVGYKHLHHHMPLFARSSEYVCLVLSVTHAGQHAKMRLPSLGDKQSRGATVVLGVQPSYCALVQTSSHTHACTAADKWQIAVCSFSWLPASTSCTTP